MIKRYDRMENDRIDYELEEKGFDYITDKIHSQRSIFKSLILKGDWEELHSYVTDIYSLVARCFFVKHKNIFRANREEIEKSIPHMHVIINQYISRSRFLMFSYLLKDLAGHNNSGKPMDNNFAKPLAFRFITDIFDYERKHFGKYANESGFYIRYDTDSVDFLPYAVRYLGIIKAMGKVFNGYFYKMVTGAEKDEDLTLWMAKLFSTFCKYTIWVQLEKERD